jgi:MFS family permease
MLHTKMATAPSDMEAPSQPARDFEHKHIVKKYLVFVVFFMSFGSMTYGASASIISTTLGQPSFYEYMGLSEGGKYYSQRNPLIGAANSIFYAGGIFGPFMHGWLADRYGRKMSIFVACAISLVAQALQAGAAHIGMFIAFRFFAGWG